jgi:hypothetical protein
MASCRKSASSQRGRNTGSAKITGTAAYGRPHSRGEVQPVIAQPDSSTPATTSTTGSNASRAMALVDHSPLSANELYQLTLYKWRYSLEAFGFNRDEVRDLMFLKWLHASRRILP